MEKGLPEAAQVAWAAYRAMELSKHRHFELLQELEARAQQGQPRRLAETAELQRLLTEHDRQVARFRDAVRALMADDPAAHAALVERLKLENRPLGRKDNPH
jgi:hypothetical protein